MVQILCYVDINIIVTADVVKVLRFENKDKDMKSEQRQGLVNWSSRTRTFFEHYQQNRGTMKNSLLTE